MKDAIEWMANITDWQWLRQLFQNSNKHSFSDVISATVVTVLLVFPIFITFRVIDLLCTAVQSDAVQKPRK